MPASRPPVPPRPDRRAAAHEVRIIGGRWKRSKLPVADRPGLRPTPDRVRETLFNWLGQDLSGWRCLDAFAGSGALGLEAASRGAAHVLLLERDATLVRSLRETVQRLGAGGVDIQCADALAWMRQHVRPEWDLILLDPPFQSEVFTTALMAARPLLASGGLIYLEADRAWCEAQAAALGLSLWRQGRAGAVHYHLLRLAPPTLASCDPAPKTS
ncbi:MULTISPECIES: 16S rRNA (guanine(966)-N(2))-methyltransferase RsmD [Caldimonas]|uniref:16S rRNA (guanine(966)-N(2))-methyltransferase RsmD n=1 Tax=Caldimonas TaxID=196013 RepID=UPI0006871148|nr:16S rRNA (guanine(966)-N(2))-methyltransferase RsmD [Caldimonas manganoxidans]MCX7659242.1 16S rRNA (guanine(966)-N(2))-methyltransferase RsmD [Caldimonas manganoxidans]